ncbi:MAG: hypothetical protein ACD_3C00054G0020 [uncultured bacterium (gcode 4)]|uniref:Uncharacterized protein n=1 Tax=uncultured bacterium (gcode 4) TaxID=1234023 RepID=K2GYE5_9BACT|nr:MAG: hypothetical protein ACD_3C00054G0020 [uncultured bacterium (gcode 4)]
MKKNKLALTSLFLYSTIFSVSSIFAWNVDLEANIPSWTYDKVIKVELNATDAAAKTFYWFDPNGTPKDLLKYDWPITIKSSTPLIFWTFVNTDNESKIKQNDYILNFTNEIRLWTGTFFEDWMLKDVKIVNTSANSVDIGYWEVRNESWKIIVPEWTILSAWWAYDIDWMSGTWIISLFSPNEEKKDFTEVLEIKKEVAIIQTQPKKIKKVARTPKKTTVAVAAQVQAMPKEIKPQDNAITPTTGNISSNTSSLATTIAPAPDNIKAPDSQEKEPIKNNDFSNSIKASTNESWTDKGDGKFIIFWVLATAILAWAWFKFIKRNN